MNSKERFFHAIDKRDIKVVVDLVESNTVKIDALKNGMNLYLLHFHQNEENVNDLVVFVRLCNALQNLQERIIVSLFL